MTRATTYEDRARTLLRSYQTTLGIKAISQEEERRLIAEFSKRLEEMDAEMATMKVEDDGEGEPEPEAFVPYHPISPVEKRALHRYVNFGYEDINKALRAGTGESDVVSVLDSLIAKHKTPEHCVVYRIVEKDSLFDRSFTELAFLSTSTDIEYLQEQETNYEDPVILKIQVPAGTPYARTKESWDDDFESEILFPRGCRLEKIRKTEFKLKT